jgi:hypothetical protein
MYFYYEIMLEHIHQRVIVTVASFVPSSKGIHRLKPSTLESLTCSDSSSRVPVPPYKLSMSLKLMTHVSYIDVRQTLKLDNHLTNFSAFAKDGGKPFNSRTILFIRADFH